MAGHQIAVEQIAKAVRAFYDRRESYLIFHGSTNSTQRQHQEKCIDISVLSNILEVNQDSCSVLVEPNVPTDKLVAATLWHGLIPPVVIEFPGITVGGGYNGSVGESSSFKHGYFDETVRSVEMVLGNGDIVAASEDENPDLFRGAAGALGTLGITTLLELRLIPAKRFVHTSYQRTISIKETIDKVKAETGNDDNDYVDAIMFSDTFGVVITGRQTDGLPGGAMPQTFSGAWDPWYYLHVKNKARSAEKSQPASDYIPLPEYLFRWGRGGFWVGRNTFNYFGLVSFNSLSRWLLDGFMRTRMLYRALHSSNQSFGSMIQDLSLPYSTAESFIRYTSTKVNIWPLWLCPLRGISEPTFHPSTTLPGPEDFPKPMLNIGLWGPASRDISSPGVLGVIAAIRSKDYLLHRNALWREA